MCPLQLPQSRVGGRLSIKGSSGENHALTWPILLSKPSPFKRNTQSSPSFPTVQYTFLKIKPHEQPEPIQTTVVLQRFFATVHNLPVRECERHYTPNQRIFFCLCLEWFLLVSIMFLLNHKRWEIIIGYCLIEYVAMTGGTKLHFNMGLLTGHHDGLIAFIMFVVCISFACSILFTALIHWAVEILCFKLPMDSPFFSTAALELLVLFQMPRDWTELWKLSLKAI